jgi:hypothetical protein
MARKEVSQQDWETFVRVARTLGIDIDALSRQDARFVELESVGHRVGRAVAQAVTERLAWERAERLTEPQPCPICKRPSPVKYRTRLMETVDGPIELEEPVCNCSACRRDFFPSASKIGTRPTTLQSCGRGQDRHGECRGEVGGQGPEDSGETGGHRVERPGDHGSQRHDRP